MSDVVCPRCQSDVSLDLEVTCVTVCSTCFAVLERKHVGLEIHGVLGPLRDTGSRLRVGLRGRYELKFFTVTGRTQMEHRSGNIWDEWYAVFDDNLWAWIAEDQGRFFLTRPQEKPSEVPSFDEVAPGHVVLVAGQSLTVGEVDEARLVAAEGELPFLFEPDDLSRYAELSGTAGVFGTIDYSHEPPRVYLGAELKPEAFFFGHEADPTTPESQGKRLDAIDCPGCDLHVELRMPRETVRYACERCGTISDVQAGKAVKVGKVELHRGASATRPTISLGMRGTLRGQAMTVVAFLQRSTQAGTTGHEWQEYLLQVDGGGLRWLTCSEGHFTLGAGLVAGEISRTGKGLRVRGQGYDHFSEGEVFTRSMSGELPFRLELGAGVRSADFIAPPSVLTVELSEGEHHYVLSEHVTAAEVATAFPSFRPPMRSGVGTAEPYAHAHGLRAFGVMLGAAFVLSMVFAFVSSPREATTYSHAFKSGASVPVLEGVPGLVDTSSVGTSSLVDLSPPFMLEGRRALEIDWKADGLDNSWVYVSAALIHQESGEVMNFDLELSRYAGSEDGEAWAEGQTYGSTRLSRATPGEYVMRVEAQRPSADHSPVSFTRRVSEDVFSWTPFWFLSFLLSQPAIFFWVGRIRHERLRWEESDVPRGSRLLAELGLRGAQ